MSFNYKDNDYEVIVTRKNNKNTYIRVRDNQIYVTTSFFTSDKYINKLLISNQKAIGKMIEKSQKKEEKNNLFSLFGNYYKIEYGNFHYQVTVKDNLIQATNETVFLNWLDKYIQNAYHHHLEKCYALFEETLPTPNLKIRKMKTRWGVCNTKNHNVTLNSELYHYEIECLDYVIIHELCHFLVPNHSKQFWQYVEKYCPNYKEIRKKLK